MRVGRGIAVNRYGSPVRAQSKPENRERSRMLFHPEEHEHPMVLSQTSKTARIYGGQASVRFAVYISGGYDVFRVHENRNLG